MPKSSLRHMHRDVDEVSKSACVETALTTCWHFMSKTRLSSDRLGTRTCSSMQNSIASAFCSSAFAACMEQAKRLRLG